VIAAVAVPVSRSAYHGVGSGRGAFPAKKIRQLRHDDVSPTPTPTNSPKRRNFKVRYYIASTMETAAVVACELRGVRVAGLLGAQSHPATVRG